MAIVMINIVVTMKLILVIMVAASLTAMLAVLTSANTDQTL